VETQPASGEHQIIARQAENTNHVAYAIRYRNVSGTYEVSGYRDKNGVASNNVTIEGQLTTNNWHHLVLTYDGSTVKLYLDGALGDSISSSGNGTGTNPNQVSIGAHYNYQGTYYYPFKGHIDEVRMSNTGHTADWIATEYNNQDAPGVFWSLVEPNPCEGEMVGGFCWFLGASNASCDTVCTNYGGYHSATRTYAGDLNSATQCNDVLTALGAAGSSTSDGTNTAGIGCSEYSSTSRWRIYNNYTTSSATVVSNKRACACQTGSNAEVAITCAGELVGGYCWHDSAEGDSCDDTCATRGGCDLTGT
jgi:hypothetical protein